MEILKFMETLDEIITEKIQQDASYYNLEQSKPVSSKERFGMIRDELVSISKRIFSDERFHDQQFRSYSNCREYIEDIISDMLKEDSSCICEI